MSLFLGGGGEEQGQDGLREVEGSFTVIVEPRLAIVVEAWQVDSVVERVETYTLPA